MENIDVKQQQKNPFTLSVTLTGGINSIHKMYSTTESTCAGLTKIILTPGLMLGAPPLFTYALKSNLHKVRSNPKRFLIHLPAVLLWHPSSSSG